jgi:hypothetical protein
MRFSLVTYSQACLHHPQEEYAKRKLIASIWLKPDSTTELLEIHNSLPLIAKTPIFGQQVQNFMSSNIGIQSEVQFQR